MNLEADLQDVPDSSTKEEMWSWHRTLKELEDLVRGTDREVSKKESEYARLRRGINMEIAHLKGQDPATYRLTVEGALGILNRLLR